MQQSKEPSSVATQAGERVAAEGDIDALKAGDDIGGKYRLLRLLGAGGMGAVWAAHNEVLDVEVAVKFLRVNEATRNVERFHQEARAAAKLGHPSIVRVLDFGQTAAGTPLPRDGIPRRDVAGGSARPAATDGADRGGAAAAAAV
jgi:hypothetical protein